MNGRGEKKAGILLIDEEIPIEEGWSDTFAHMLGM